MEESDDIQEIKIKDLNEAAFLWCHDEIILKTLEGDKRGNRKTTIYFIFTSELSPEKINDLRKVLEK